MHVVLCTFCACESEPATLIRLGLWPASPRRPTTAISLCLMRLISAVQLECGVSIRGLSAAVQEAFSSTKVCYDMHVELCITLSGLTLLVLLFKIKFCCILGTQSLQHSD